MERSPIHISDPGDFIALIPNIVGYIPDNQTVVVVIDEGSAMRFTCALQTDDPDPQSTLVWALNAFLGQVEEAEYRLMMVTYATPGGPLPDLLAGPIPVGHWFAVHAGWWWCLNEDCPVCPEHVQAVPKGPSVLDISNAVERGIPYTEPVSVAELTAGLQAVRTTLTDEQVAAVEDSDMLGSPWPDDLPSKAAVTSFMLATPQVRDIYYEELALADDDHLAFLVQDLTDMARELPDAAAPCLLPMAALGHLLQGDGTRARILLDRVPEWNRTNDPYVLSMLAFESGASPSTLKAMLTTALEHESE